MPEQRTILEQVKLIFPSFEKLGLSRTNLVYHVIDVDSAKPVKQRYYSVSPIIQTEIHEEID